MNEILGTSGGGGLWSKHAEVIKAYALNSAGQTCNLDPTETVFDLDSTPLRSNITGLQVISNQIYLPTGFEYLLRASTMVINPSGNQVSGFLFFRNLADTNMATNRLGGQWSAINGSSGLECKSIAQFRNDSGSDMKIEFRGIFGINAGSSVTVARYSSPGFSSTAVIDDRVRVLIDQR